MSLVVHVSPEGRSSEVAGARLARRDKISEKSKDSQTRLIRVIRAIRVRKNICEIRDICVIEPCLRAFICVIRAIRVRKNFCVI